MESSTIFRHVANHTSILTHALAAAAIAAILLFPCQAAAIPTYSLSGVVHTCAVPVGCDEYRETTLHDQQTRISDNEALVGSGNNWAVAQYHADLTTGSIGARAYATRGWDGSSWTPSRASASVSIYDTLLFEIPPGIYLDGLFAEAIGSVSGHVSRYGNGTQVSGQYEVRIGSSAEGWLERVIDLRDVDAPSDVLINDSFILSTQLIPPGSTLTDWRTVEKPIFAGLGNSMILAASTWSLPRDMEGFADSNFLDSLRFDSINVPAGIAWTSASGVFLSHVPSPGPTPVPEPSTTLLIITGLISFLAFKKFRTDQST